MSLLIMFPIARETWHTTQVKWSKQKKERFKKARKKKKETEQKKDKAIDMSRFLKIIGMELIGFGKHFK